MYVLQGSVVQPPYVLLCEGVDEGLGSVWLAVGVGAGVSVALGVPDGVTVDVIVDGGEADDDAVPGPHGYDCTVKPVGGMLDVQYRMA